MVYTPQSGEHADQEVRKLEVVVDEIGPSLRWTTVEITKATAHKAPQPDEEPF